MLAARSRKVRLRSAASAAVGPSLGVIAQPEAASAALHRTRRVLLGALRQPDSAAGLARRLGLPRQRLNYHLRELERRGLIECVEERRKGNCTERVMRATARAFMISPDAIGALPDLGSGPAAAADRCSASFAIAVAARTLREVSSLEARARDAGKRIATLTLDGEVRFASAASRAAFTEELSAAVAALVSRYHDVAAPGGRRFRLTVCAHPAVTSKPEEP